MVEREKGLINLLCGVGGGINILYIAHCFVFNLGGSDTSKLCQHSYDILMTYFQYPY